jgi:hypothetical protein
MDPGGRLVSLPNRSAHFARFLDFLQLGRLQLWVGNAGSNQALSSKRAESSVEKRKSGQSAPKRADHFRGHKMPGQVTRNVCPGRKVLIRLWQSLSSDSTLTQLLAVKSPLLAGRQPGERSIKASDGSRTHNPRITNAVLCQLKLRWRSVLEFIISDKSRQYLAFSQCLRGIRPIQRSPFLIWRMSRIPGLEGAKIAVTCRGLGVASGATLQRLGFSRTAKA